MKEVFLCKNFNFAPEISVDFINKLFLEKKNPSESPSNFKVTREFFAIVCVCVHALHVVVVQCFFVGRPIEMH